MNHDQLRTLIIVALIIVPFWVYMAIAILTVTPRGTHRAIPDDLITPSFLAFQLYMADDHQHLANTVLCPAEAARHLTSSRYYSTRAADAAQRHPEMLEEAHNLYTTYKETLP